MGVGGVEGEESLGVVCRKFRFRRHCKVFKTFETAILNEIRTALRAR